ncbi:MAG TPA: NAD(P)/FAD-dependent oxidoreductase [Candidatus Competibacteraceae bacterium]|nr:NAD(P)/FAD-dependent oxidoreductase [Candidatus Competibacteraceae bacterium]
MAMGRGHVTVTTLQETYQADQVLATLPLGVLQAGTVAFSPPLPPTKQAAIARVGMGALLKVALSFARPFWPAEPAAFAAFFPRLPPFFYVLNGLYLHSAPLLMAFAGSARAQALERQSDRAVVTAVRRSLQRLFGWPIPPPDDVRVTRWSHDPFARGAYSYLAAGTSLDNYDHLVEPVNGRLFFADEHTTHDCPATLAGAFLSGQREAERLLALVWSVAWLVLTLIGDYNPWCCRNRQEGTSSAGFFLMTSFAFASALARA